MKQLLTFLFTSFCTSILLAQPIVNPLTIPRQTFFKEVQKTTHVPEGVSDNFAPKPEKPLPYMEWQSPVHNFGVVDRGNPVSGIFAFRNIGDEPILIKKANGVCGCTGVEYPKDPILPGEIAEIVATYDAKIIGPFKKEVLVQTNLHAEDEKTVLYIEGEVIWELSEKLK